MTCTYLMMSVHTIKESATWRNEVWIEQDLTDAVRRGTFSELLMTLTVKWLEHFSWLIATKSSAHCCEQRKWLGDLSDDDDDDDEDDDEYDDDNGDKQTWHIGWPMYQSCLYLN